MARPRSNPSVSDENGTAKSANKERVRFIFEPDRHSPNGVTFSWLVHNTHGGKQKAATATRAFWMPFAYQDNGHSSEAELKEMAQQCVWLLEEQIQHLREAFGLDTSTSFRPAIAAASPKHPLPDIGTALESHRVGASPASLSESESSQSSILSTVAVTEDAGILDEFGDAV
jgi:hypothetical protein